MFYTSYIGDRHYSVPFVNSIHHRKGSTMKIIEYIHQGTTTTRYVHTDMTYFDYDNYFKALDNQRDTKMIVYSKSKYFTENGVVCCLVDIYPL